MYTALHLPYKVRSNATQLFFELNANVDKESVQLEGTRWKPESVKQTAEF